jgi:hypothetical protein
MSVRIRLVNMLVVAASALSVIGVAGVAEAKPRPDPIIVSEETGNRKLDAFCDRAVDDALGNARAGRSAVAAGVVREANAEGCKIELY